MPHLESRFLFFFYFLVIFYLLFLFFRSRKIVFISCLWLLQSHIFTWNDIFYYSLTCIVGWSYMSSLCGCILCGDYKIDYMSLSPTNHFFCRFKIHVSHLGTPFRGSINQGGARALFRFATLLFVSTKKGRKIY